MNVSSVELFTSMLAVVAVAGSIGYAVACWIGGPFRPVAEAVRMMSGWLTLAVATVSMFGSLYFSEVADYVPCRLCWFQRICMYPLVGILAVGLVRRDRAARWYALPIAAVGLVISTYHYIIEWKPSLGEGACGVGPSCTDVWFRRMGFATLSFMALCGFVSILLLLFVEPRSVQTRNDQPQNKGQHEDGARAQ